VVSTIEVCSTYEVSAGQQGLALGVAVSGHLAIVAALVTRLRRSD